MIETIEVPEWQGFSRIKEAVKLRRFIKELSHEEDINLSGNKGQKLDMILDNADLVLSQLQEEHADWIEQRHQLLSGYLAPVKPIDVEENYRAGLATTITQEFRTYNKVSKIEAEKLNDPEYLKEVITGYTVDFLRSLNLSKRFGIYPNTALEIARLSYHYNPTKLIELIKQYPDINLNVVRVAALHYPKNPEAFLDGFIANVAWLTEDPGYQDLNPGVINSAALNYPKNPEAFLDGFIANVARLVGPPRYQGLNLSIINTAALNYPKNPEAFLDGFIANVARLTGEYPDMSKRLITMAALHYPSKPEAYIEKVRAGKILVEISEEELEVLVPIGEIEEATLQDLSINGENLSPV